MKCFKESNAQCIRVRGWASLLDLFDSVEQYYIYCVSNNKQTINWNRIIGKRCKHWSAAVTNGPTIRREKAQKRTTLALLDLYLCSIPTLADVHWNRWLFQLTSLFVDHRKAKQKLSSLSCLSCHWRKKSQEFAANSRTTDCERSSTLLLINYFSFFFFAFITIHSTFTAMIYEDISLLSKVETIVIIDRHPA